MHYNYRLAVRQKRRHRRAWHLAARTMQGCADATRAVGLNNGYTTLVGKGSTREFHGTHSQPKQNSWLFRVTPHHLLCLVLRHNSARTGDIQHRLQRSVTDDPLPGLALPRCEIFACQIGLSPHTLCPSTPSYMKATWRWWTPCALRRITGKTWHLAFGVLYADLQ